MTITINPPRSGVKGKYNFRSLSPIKPKNGKADEKNILIFTAEKKEIRAIRSAARAFASRSGWTIRTRTLDDGRFIVWRE